MKITLLQIGKTNDVNITGIIEDYFKRIKRYMPFEIVTIPDVKFSRKDNIEKLKNAEGKLIIQRIKKEHEVFILDSGGVEMSSKEFSSFISGKINYSRKELLFIIGGAYGFSEKVYEIANKKLSLSKMTFPHQLVRIIFLEQLYRAFTIIYGEPYHNE